MNYQNYAQEINIITKTDSQKYYTLPIFSM